MDLQLEADGGISIEHFLSACRCLVPIFGKSDVLFSKKFINFFLWVMIDVPGIFDNQARRCAVIGISLFFKHSCRQVEWHSFCPSENGLSRKYKSKYMYTCLFSKDSGCLHLI